MGLDAVLGLAENDEYGDEVRERIGVVLRAAGLPALAEPEGHEDAGDGLQVGGYSALHHLRRYAAYLRAGWAPAPLTGPDPKASADPLLKAYYETGGRREIGPGVYEYVGVRSVGPSFDHLVHHSDADGVYLPVDFERPMWLEVGDAQFTVGSSVRLAAELEVIWRKLGPPADLTPDDERLFEGAGEQPGLVGRSMGWVKRKFGLSRGEEWRRFVDVVGPLVRLRSVARRSVETGLVIVFC